MAEQIPDWLQRILMNSDGVNGYTGYDPGFAGVDPSGLGGMRYDAVTGKGYMPTFAPTVGGDEGSNVMSGGQQTGWRDFDAKDSMDAENKSILNGRGYTNYDMQGQAKDTGTWQGLTKGSAEKQFIEAMAVILGGYAAGSGLAAAGVGGVTAGGASGALAGGGAATAGGLGAAGTGVTVGGPMTMGGATGTALPSMGSMGGVGAAGAGAGALGGGGSAATATGASTLGGSGGLFGTGITAQQGLGLLSTAAGGLMGSKGNESTTTAGRTMDPRMDQFIYGDPKSQTPGLFNYTQSQLAASQSPARMAEADAIRKQGLGLLQQPIAGNGFSRFSSR